MVTSDAHNNRAWYKTKKKFMPNRGRISSASPGVRDVHGAGRNWHLSETEESPMMLAQTQALS